MLKLWRRWTRIKPAAIWPKSCVAPLNSLAAGI
jgi:hypothetical protein